MTLFGLGGLASGRRPGPDVLGQAMALPPLDTFGDLELSDGPLSPWAPPIFVVRVALVTSALALVLGIRPGLKSFARVAGVYVLSLLSMAVPVLTGLGYFTARSDPAARDNAVAPVLLIAFLVVLVVLGAVLATVAGRAVAGGRLWPLLNKPSVWGLVLVSTLVWLFGIGAIRQAPGEPPSTIGYVAAFGVVILQSIIYGAVAITSVEAANDRSG